MKKERFFLMGMLAIALAFGMAVVGCGDGDSDGGGSDPVNVNLSLPSVQKLDSFSGTFVSDKNEALEMVQESIEALDEFTSIIGSGSESRSAYRSTGRSVQNEPIEYIIKNEQIAEGVVANGFMTGNYRTSIKNDNGPITVGDYYEMSARIKLAVDFTDIQNDGFTFNGKYVYDEDIYEKMLQKTNSSQQLTFRLNAANGYALSVSKNGKGLKFVMQLTASINGSWNQSDYSDDDYPDILEKAKIKLTIDVYDNNNKKQHTQVFNDLESASKYLGDSFLGL